LDAINDQLLITSQVLKNLEETRHKKQHHHHPILMPVGHVFTKIMVILTLALFETSAYSKNIILNWKFLVDGGTDPGRYNLAGRFPMATFLARQLPSSIPDVMLFVKINTERGHQSAPWLKGALKELLNESKARLPDLKLLRIVGMSRLKMEQLSATMLVKRFQCAGISLSFTGAEDAYDIEDSLESCGYYDEAP